MKDCNGTDLFVGDEVVYTNAEWAGLIYAVVIGFSPKRIRLERTGKYSSVTTKDSSQVALYKRSESCSCEGCDLPIHTYPDGHTRGMCQSCTEYRHDLPSYDNTPHH